VPRTLPCWRQDTGQLRSPFLKNIFGPDEARETPSSCCPTREEEEEDQQTRVVVMELEVSDDDLFIKSILEPAAAVDCGGGQCHPNEADGVAEEGDMNNNADPFFLFTDLAYDDTNPLLSPPVSSMMDPTLASPSSYSSPCRGDSSFFFSSTSSSSSTTPTSSPLSLQTTEDSSFSSSSWPSPCHQPEALQQEQQLNLEFNSWLATALPSSALEPGNATPATISPAQLGLHQHHHGLPQIIPPSPPPVASSPQHGDSDDSEDPGCMDSATGRRGRKRKRPKKSGGSSPSGPQTAVSLPREELLKLSSQGLSRTCSLRSPPSPPSL